MTAKSAARFLAGLEALRSDEEQAKYSRYVKTGPGDYAEGDFFTGVRMGEVFALAGDFAGMDLPDLEALLEQDIHEARAGAVKIMALQAAAKKTPGRRRRELFELYLRRHDRINNWDLVDLGAPAVGGWLRDAGRSDRPRLLQFLDSHAATMPRVALRYAIEHLDKTQRRHYLELGAPRTRTTM